MRGKILTLRGRAYRDSTPPLEAVDCIVKGEDLKDYLLLSPRAYLEIDTRLRAPGDYGFWDNAQVADEVEFEFFEYQSKFVISKIILLKMR